MIEINFHLDTKKLSNRVSIDIYMSTSSKDLTQYK